MLRAHDAQLRAGLDGLSLVGAPRSPALLGGTEHWVRGRFAQPSVEGNGLPVPGRRRARRRRLARHPRGRVHPRLRGESELPAARPPMRSAPTARTSSTESCTRTSPASAARSRPRPSTSPGRGAAGGEDRRRWRDGTPLDLRPELPDPALATDGAQQRVLLQGDEDGLRCPVGAHIRRANPRLGLPFEGSLSTATD
jgi:hypothetical protein